MVESRITPVVSVMAGAALPRKVIGRLIARVTGNTISLALMVKGRIVPVARVMTLAALPREVIGRSIAGVT